MLPTALHRMYFALKPGGALFAYIGPVWSAHDGHHLPPIRNKWGTVMDFHHSPIPPWGHLLMRPPQLYAHLHRHTDSEAAARIVNLVYHSDLINRLFTEDYVAFFNESRFDVKEITLASPANIPEDVQKRLEALYPGRKHFRNNGIIAVLQRPT